MERVLVLAYSDDAFRLTIVSALAREGLSVVSVLISEASAEQILSHNPDLVLIQNISPERSPAACSGIELLHLLRRTSAVPLIMLAEDDDEDRIVEALQAGADDYLVQPISPRELTTRISVILRRVVNPGNDATHIVRAGPITLNTECHTATINNRPILFSVPEFRLLETLARSKSHVLTRSQLLQAVWGPLSAPYDHTLTTYIRRLRRKIEADPAMPRHIVTVQGVGYKFVS